MEPDHIPADRSLTPQARFATPLGATIAAVAVCAVSWVVLRHPPARAFLLGLAGHRLSGPAEQVRFLLAPRSVLTAAVAVCAVCALGAAIPSWRRRLGERLRPASWLVAFVLCLQVSVAFAVVANGEWFFLRQFRKPAGFVNAETVLSYSLPQAWPDSRRLLALLDPKTDRVAMRVEGDDRFFLPSLCYPLEFYDIWPTDPSNWRADPGFLARANHARLTHLLIYRPLDRANPIELSPVR